MAAVGHRKCGTASPFFIHMEVDTIWGILTVLGSNHGRSMGQTLTIKRKIFNERHLLVLYDVCNRRCNLLSLDAIIKILIVEVVEEALWPMRGMHWIIYQTTIVDFEFVDSLWEFEEVVSF